MIKLNLMELKLQICNHHIDAKFCSINSSFEATIKWIHQMVGLNNLQCRPIAAVMRMDWLVTKLSTCSNFDCTICMIFFSTFTWSGWAVGTGTWYDPHSPGRHAWSKVCDLTKLDCFIVSYFWQNGSTIRWL